MTKKRLRKGRRMTTIRRRALHSRPPLPRARKRRKNQVMMRIIEAQVWRRKKWLSLAST
jgi:hypothetical protein